MRSHARGSSVLIAAIAIAGGMGLGLQPLAASAADPAASVSLAKVDCDTVTLSFNGLATGDAVRVVDETKAIFQQYQGTAGSFSLDVPSGHTYTAVVVGASGAVKATSASADLVTGCATTSVTGTWGSGCKTIQVTSSGWPADYRVLVRWYGLNGVNEQQAYVPVNTTWSMPVDPAVVRGFSYRVVDAKGNYATPRLEEAPSCNLVLTQWVEMVKDDCDTVTVSAGNLPLNAMASGGYRITDETGAVAAEVKGTTGGTQSFDLPTGHTYTATAGLYWLSTGKWYSKAQSAPVDLTQACPAPPEPEQPIVTPTPTPTPTPLPLPSGTPTPTPTPADQPTVTPTPTPGQPTVTPAPTAPGSPAQPTAPTTQATTPAPVDQPAAVPAKPGTQPVLARTGGASDAAPAALLVAGAFAALGLRRRR